MYERDRLLDESYFEYLCHFVEREDYVDIYKDVLRSLFYIEFVVSDRAPRDANRLEDGLRYRELFAESENLKDLDESFYDQPATCLEVIVGLAYKMRFQADMPTAVCFWSILDNAGLTDAVFAGSGNDVDDLVREIMEFIMDRKYRMDGSGGFFPVGKNDYDYRDVELLLQMYDYVNAKFYY